MELEHRLARQTWDSLIEEGIVVVKATVKGEDEGFEHQPWPDGEWVLFKVTKTELRPKFNPEEGEEINVVCEAMDAPWTGQWAYLNVNHLNKNGQPNLVFDMEGEPLSTWAKLKMAVQPDFDPKKDEADPMLQDVEGKLFNGFIEPKKNKKYAKFLKFKPLSDKQVEALAKEFTGSKKKDEEPEEIPFHHRAFTHEVGHAHYTQRRTALW